MYIHTYIHTYMHAYTQTVGQNHLHRSARILKITCIVTLYSKYTRALNSQNSDEHHLHRALLQFSLARALSRSLSVTRSLSLSLSLARALSLSHTHTHTGRCCSSRLVARSCALPALQENKNKVENVIKTNRCCSSLRAVCPPKSL